MNAAGGRIERANPLTAIMVEVTYFIVVSSSAARTIGSWD
jgi:hypothetical protein